MREVLKSFPKTDNTLFSIDLCGTSYCDGSYKMNRKKSPFFVFEYIISGTGTIVTKNGIVHPEAGDVYMLRAGEDHNYYSDADTPWTKIWFNIRGELVEKLVDMYGIGDTYIFFATVVYLACLMSSIKMPIVLWTDIPLRTEMQLLFTK